VDIRGVLDTAEKKTSFYPSCKWNSCPQDCSQSQCRLISPGSQKECSSSIVWYCKQMSTRLWRAGTPVVWTAISFHTDKPILCIWEKLAEYITYGKNNLAHAMFVTVIPTTSCPIYCVVFLHAIATIMPFQLSLYFSIIFRDLLGFE
jgi:hypothetical protein